MATAFTKKTRAEQLRNHAATSASTHESICGRCGGLLVIDFYMDLLFCIGETEFAAQRCVQCGEIVDPVILHNRGMNHEPMTAQATGRMLPNNRATNVPGRFALQTYGQAFAMREGPRAGPAEVDEGVVR